MERINLSKYGFYRTPDKDFSDDGTRFTCYSLAGADRIRLSKAKWQNYIYLSATIYGNLDYDEYVELLHYKGLNRLNGISIGILTEADLEQLAADCIAYQKEYEAAEKQIVYPTEKELVEKLTTIKHIRETEYKNILNLIRENLDILLTTGRYEFESIMDYAKAIKQEANTDIESRVKQALGKHDSRYIIKSQGDLKSSWYYREAVEKINKIKNKCLQTA